MTFQLILEFIAAIAFLIIIHEIGHFVACRIVGVEVEEFGIGIPPRALTMFEAGGTKFTLNWLPLGGFVRPKGEMNPDVPGGLAASPAWKRIFVMFAGPFMNLLAAFVMFTVMYGAYGDPIAVPDQVQIVGVDADSPASEAGLKSCDVVVSIAGQSVTDPDGLSAIVAANVGQPTELTYSRDGELVSVVLVPRANPPVGKGAMGVQITNRLEFIPASTGAVIPLSFQAMANTGTEILRIPLRIFSGNTAPEEGRLVGFKGMYDIYASLRSGDLLACAPQPFNVMNYLVMLSISLGLLNLLPIPALDGGRILFDLPELILRRRISPQYENFVNIITFVSFILLIGALLFVNFRDFINPVQFP